MQAVDRRKDVRRALTQLPLVATGNIAYDEIPAYLKAGVVGFGIGAPLLAGGDHNRALPAQGRLQTAAAACLIGPRDRSRAQQVAGEDARVPRGVGDHLREGFLRHIQREIVYA